jgi:hypothetical protein
MSSAEQSLPALPEKLPVILIHPDQPFYRLNHSSYERSLHFGRTGTGRFDDPSFNNPNKEEGYHVLYTGEDAGVCFLETLANSIKSKSVSWETLKNYNLFLVSSKNSSIKLVDLTGENLSKLRTDVNVIYGGDTYQVPQAWSRAIWEHPDKVDGIRFRSRRDNNKYCYAIFNRVKRLQSIKLGTLKDCQYLTSEILGRYGFEAVGDTQNSSEQNNRSIVVSTEIII